MRGDLEVPVLVLMCQLLKSLSYSNLWGWARNLGIEQAPLNYAPVWDLGLFLTGFQLDKETNCVSTKYVSELNKQPFSLRLLLFSSSVVSDSAILWTAAGLASLSFTISWSLLKLMSIQTHGDAIQPSHPLSPTSPPALNLSQHQSLFQWVSSSHQVTKVLELQLPMNIRSGLISCSLR